MQTEQAARERGESRGNADSIESAEEARGIRETSGAARYENTRAAQAVKRRGSKTQNCHRAKDSSRGTLASVPRPTTFVGMRSLIDHSHECVRYVMIAMMRFKIAAGALLTLEIVRL